MLSCEPALRSTLMDDTTQLNMRARGVDFGENLLRLNLLFPFNFLCLLLVLKGRCLYCPKAEAHGLYNGGEGHVWHGKSSSLAVVAYLCRYSALYIEEADLPV